MTYIIAAINQGKPKQVVTTEIDSTEIDAFDVKVGAILYNIPLLRKSGRTFAGGNIVLKERLDALTSGDESKINVWGNIYFDLADLCLTFEDQVKFQADSSLLTGIRGVVETQDGLFVAIDAEAVAKATKDKGYFKVSGSETVKYGVGDNQRSETAKDVVLLRYVAPNYVELNAEQFNSVNAEPLRRKDMILGRDMTQEEIVKGGKVIHRVFALYSEKLVIPLVEKTFEYIKRKYSYDTNMGLYLASSSQDHAEMRALFVTRLVGGSGLYGDDDLGDGFSLVVGVASGCVARVEKK